MASDNTKEPASGNGSNAMMGLTANEVKLVLLITHCSDAPLATDWDRVQTLYGTANVDSLKRNFRKIRTTLQGLDDDALKAAAKQAK
jgi:hypothetical protein